jgi:hypothetical protein
LGDLVSYVDDDTTIRQTFGDDGFDKLMTYMRGESLPRPDLDPTSQWL